MENKKIESESTNLIKIELNNFGDYITISLDNPVFFDKFAAGYKKIADMAGEVSAKLEEINKKYGSRDDSSAAIDKALEMSCVNVDFSKEAVSVIDGIFGTDTVKKYFRNICEEIPDFLPDANCIFDFLEKIAPVLEDLFGSKIEREQKASKARMAKYQPQNHKRPQRKTK